MKIIFLDIDGVLNHTGYFKRSDKHPLQEFDPHAVQLLKEILEATNAKIVVSSRNGLTPENRDEAIRMLGRDV